MERTGARYYKLIVINIYDIKPNVNLGFLSKVISSISSPPLVALSDSLLVLLTLELASYCSLDAFVSM